MTGSMRNLTYFTVADCLASPLTTLEEVTIHGHAGLLRGFCRAQIEATVVVGNRAYVFTLFDLREVGATASEEEARALFDAFTATIKLDPARPPLARRASSPS